MIKYCLHFILLLILFTSCKKKNAGGFTEMTVKIVGDSTWTTNFVTTNNPNNGNLYISGIKSATGQSINITMYNYKEGVKTYYIDSLGSAANYQYNHITSQASTGEINITSYSSQAIEGSFDVQNDTIHVTGTFNAPNP